jgi:hypothetical protein
MCMHRRAVARSLGHEGRGLRHAAPLGDGTRGARIGLAHQQCDAGRGRFAARSMAWQEQLPIATDTVVSLQRYNCSDTSQQRYAATLAEPCYASRPALAARKGQKGIVWCSSVTFLVHWPHPSGKGSSTKWGSVTKPTALEPSAGAAHACPSAARALMIEIKKIIILVIWSIFRPI